MSDDLINGNGNLFNFRIKQLEEDLKEMKETLYGKEGLQSTVAVIQHTTAEVKEMLQERIKSNQTREWTLISGIILLLVGVGIDLILKVNS